MKIQCTKQEWKILHSMLLANHDTGEIYKFPDFKVNVYYPETEYPTLFIIGTFQENNTIN